MRAATTTAGTLLTDFAAGNIVDGVTLVAGNRILIKNQATATENGIYVVQSLGAPSRSDDMQLGTSVSGVLITVLAGTINATSLHICRNTPGTDVVGTDNLTFSRVDISNKTSVSNILTYSICNTATTVSDVATVLATSNWIWKQSKYGAAGTTPVTSGTLTYMYTSDAGGVGKTLTVSVYNTTTALVLSTDAFVIPAITTGVARAFAFTLPTADAQLQLQVSRTAGAATVINIIGGHLELVLT